MFGKILACQEGPNWPNLCVPQLWKHFFQDWLILFYILHEVEWLKVLKIEGAKFFLKILACVKTSQKCPKWSNLISVCPLWLHFFSEFCMNLRGYKAQGSQVFSENSCLPENRPKWLKLPRFACSSITATFFRGIGSLVFSDILCKWDHKYLKLEPNLSRKFLPDPNGPKWLNLFVYQLLQHSFTTSFKLMALPNSRVEEALLSKGSSVTMK